MFQQLLREESIGLPFEAPNREAALAEMIALLPSSELPARKKANLLDLLLQREFFGTTALGEGVALPHCIATGLERTQISLGISRRGIAYPSLDGEPVYLVMLIVFREDVTPEEKKDLLHDAEALLKDRFLKARLQISESPAEAYEFVMREFAYLTRPFKVASGH